MAGLAHLGVGLAAKHVAPNVNAGVLVVSAYAIDIVWGAFWAAGVEQYAGSGVAHTAPWSHGLFMSVVWSVLTASAAWLISRNRRTSLIIGLVVFSHWVVDFMVKPMTFAFPTDSGLPLLFDGSPTVGLGLYRTQIGQNVGEYGSAILGLLIYIYTVIKRRREKKRLAQCA